jgi:hypothetical protein
MNPVAVGDWTDMGRNTGPQHGLAGLMKMRSVILFSFFTEF